MVSGCLVSMSIDILPFIICSPGAVRGWVLPSRKAQHLREFPSLALLFPFFLFNPPLVLAPSFVRYNLKDSDGIHLAATASPPSLLCPVANHNLGFNFRSADPAQ